MSFSPMAKKRTEKRKTVKIYGKQLDDRASAGRKDFFGTLIDKPPFGRYNIFWGTTRCMKAMKEKILHEI